MILCRLTYAGRPPIKSAFLVTKPEVAHLVRIHAIMTDHSPLQVPKAYGLLLNHLMSSISKRLSARELRASMREVGRSLAKEHSDELAKKSRNERLLAALDLLKKLGGSVALHEMDGKSSFAVRVVRLPQ